MDLSKLEKLKGTERTKKRVGRGIGSGKGGHTVGRGNKGQKARSGNRKPHLGFEGGQVPLYKRLPQMNGFRGWAKPTPVTLSIFNVFKDGEEVTPNMLLERKLIKDMPKSGVKILGGGELKSKVTLKDFRISASAKKKIEKAGAKVLE